jgi:hypothetical protein
MNKQCWIFVVLLGLSKVICAEDLKVVVPLVRSFAELVARGEECRLRSIDGAFFRQEPTTNNWPTDERRLFSNLPKEEMCKYLLYRLSREKNWDGERASIISSLYRDYDSLHKEGFESWLESQDGLKLNAFVRAIGGDHEVLTSNVRQVANRAGK